MMWIKRAIFCSVILAHATAFASDGNGLVQAAKRQDPAAVRAALQRGSDVNASEADGATALHWAAHRNDAHIVDLLVRAGADANAVTDLQVTPLTLASANGSEVIVRRL